jgi:4-hydroxy-2-oxoglutarate aldolase
VEAAAGDKILVAGTAAESTSETIFRTRRAAELGYAVALVRTPHYYQSQMTHDVLAAFYRRVADASPIPILIYAIPQFTGITVEAPLVARLAEHPNIIGIKESSGSVLRAAEIRRAVPAGFAILVGSASTFFPSMLVGATGGIMALADALPAECVELYELAVAGENERGRALQERLLPASKTLVSRFGVAGMKYALDRLGYHGGPVREPLQPLGEAALGEIDRVLGELSAAAPAKT